MKNVKQIDVLIFIVIFCFVVDFQFGLAQPVVSPQPDTPDREPKVRLQRRQQALGSMLGAAASIPYFGLQAGLNGLSGMGNSLMNNLGYLGYGASNGLSNFGNGLANGFYGGQYNLMNSAYNMPYLNAYHNPYSSIHLSPFYNPYQYPYQNPFFSPINPMMMG